MCTNVPLYVLCIHVRVCIIIDHFLSMRPVYVYVQQYKFPVCTCAIHFSGWYVRRKHKLLLTVLQRLPLVTNCRLRQHCSTACRTDGSRTTQFATQACHTNNTTRKKLSMVRREPLVLTEGFVSWCLPFSGYISPGQRTLNPSI